MYEYVLFTVQHDKKADIAFPTCLLSLIVLYRYLDNNINNINTYSKVTMYLGTKVTMAKPASISITKS